MSTLRSGPAPGHAELRLLQNRFGEPSRTAHVSRASGTPAIALPAEGGYCRRMSQRSAGMGFPTLPDGVLYRGWDCFLPPAIALHQSESCRLGGLPSRLWFAGRWPWRRKVAINTPACRLPNSSKRTDGRFGPSPLHHGPCGIGVGQQSLQVPQLCGRSSFHNFAPRCRSVRRLIRRQ